MSTLYIIATPIGNLEDVTLRALRVLKEVDAVFCEDTRVTGKLLAHFGISKPLTSLRERAQDKAIEKAITLLQGGKDIAYTSDAGTPGISDPGGKLVAQVMQALGSTVTISPIPGPSALIAASCIAGIPLDRFLFMGFPPHKKGRKTYFAQVASAEYPVVFYESPHRIIKSLRELDSAYKSRRTVGIPTSSNQGNEASGLKAISPDSQKKLSKEIADPRQSRDYKLIICRELTKKFETVYRGTIEQVLPEIEKNPRGEFVVIVYQQKN